MTKYSLLQTEFLSSFVYTIYLLSLILDEKITKEGKKEVEDDGRKVVIIHYAFKERVKSCRQ